MADIEGSDAGLRELALFAGAGGGILGGKLLGWRTVCAVEYEPYPASVLAQRQNDGLLPPFPIWDDVRTFDGRPWRGVVGVVSGGFPCQDISVAGKGAGIDGERSGLWGHMARIVGEVRPRFVFVENSPALITRGLGRVLGDLAALGYDCRWTVLGAADVGAPHQRARFWLCAARNIVLQHADHEWAGRWEQQPKGACTAGALAYAHSLRQLQPQGCQCDERGRPGNCGEDLGHASPEGLPTPWTQPTGAHRWEAGRMPAAASWWSTEPDVGRVADGVAARVDRLKAIGNGQVPICAATAFRLLTGGSQ